MRSYLMYQTLNILFSVHIWGINIHGVGHGESPLLTSEEKTPTPPPWTLLWNHNNFSLSTNIYLLNWWAFTILYACTHTHTFTTLNILISKCGKLVRVTLDFLYAMKLVSPKDLGCIVHPGTWHYSSKVLTIGVKVWALGNINQSTSTWHYSLTSMWHTLITITN
jgi:hypothetical protein